MSNIGAECGKCEAGVFIEGPEGLSECENCGMRPNKSSESEVAIQKSGNLYRQVALLTLTIDEIAERLDNLEKKLQNDLQILVNSNYEHGDSIESIIRAFERHEVAHKREKGDLYNISGIGAE